MASLSTASTDTARRDAQDKAMRPTRIWSVGCRQRKEKIGLHGARHLHTARRNRNSFYCLRRYDVFYYTFVSQRSTFSRFSGNNSRNMHQSPSCSSFPSKSRIMIMSCRACMLIHLKSPSLPAKIIFHLFFQKLYCFTNA